MSTTVQTQTITVDAPVADAARLQACCDALINRLGDMEMPIDELRIREAGGCVGGLLVDMMLSRSITVPAAEASAVADLCAALRDHFADEDERRIIAALHTHASAARDAGADLTVTFR